MNKPTFNLFHSGIANTKPNEEITLEKFFELIKTDTLLFQSIRACSDNKEEKNKLKKKLSYVTFAGVFSKRGNNNLIKSSGYACLDVDNVQNLEEIKKQINQNKYTLCSFISPSGKGIKFLVKIPEVKSNEEYKAYWSSIAEHYGIKETDEANKDISRACYLSYDPMPYFNSNSEVYTNKFIEESSIEKIEIKEEKEGFVGIKVINKEVFNDIEKIIEKNNLILYNGSVKQYKIYHITTQKPDKISNLKLIGASIKEASITGILVFSDKIVCSLDNKKHVTIAEGKEVNNILHKNKDEFKKLIGVKLQFGVEEIIEKAQTKEVIKEKSRSEKEMSELCRLIGKGKTKEEVFKEMGAFAKWSSSPEQYKEISYNKAFKYIQSKNNKPKNKDNFDRDMNLPNGDLKTFIFDKDQVIKKKVFSSHLLNDSLFGFGLLLPREEDKKDGTGKILYTYQTWRGVVLTSNKRGLVVSEWLKKEHKIDYDCIPQQMNLRWELSDIRDYLDGKAETISGLDLLNIIKREYEYYNFYREQSWYNVNTLWDIGTYLHQLFSAFPLKENRGIAGTGKTKSMNVSSYITLNATDIMTNPSEATLFRLTDDLRPTKYIDEAEKLFKSTKFGMESDNRVELINASYTRNGSVPRQEKLGKGYVTKWYKVYSPTQISSINGLFGATESRAITQIHTKSPDNDNRGERDPEDDVTHPKWKQIRNKCYLWALQNWKNVYDTYLTFDVKTTLKKRDLQIWKPLLVIAKVIDEKELLPNVLNFAEKLSSQRKNDLLNEESLDYKFLKCVYEVLKNGEVIGDKVFVNSIRIKYNQEYKAHEPTDTSYNRTISNHLDKLGFKDLREKDHKKGSYYLMSKQIFEEIVNPLTTDFSSQSSQSSQDKGKEQNKEDEMGTIRDDNINKNTLLSFDSSSQNEKEENTFVPVSPHFKRERDGRDAKTEECDLMKDTEGEVEENEE